MINGQAREYCRHGGVGSSFFPMVSILKLPASTRHLSLFLDFDGTLVPIASGPQAIQIPPGLVELLHAASQALGGRLALISGRTIADLDSHLGMHDLAVVGSHGREFRLADGEIEVAVSGPDLAELEAVIQARANSLPGLEVEPKRFGIALHYRKAPHLAAQVRDLADEIAQLSRLSVKPGKMVAEILPPGSDKGSAVRRIMDDRKFRGSVPVFIGDDITDEDGFRAVREFNGMGVLVGERQGSLATARLDSPEDVRRLLAQIVEDYSDS